MKIDLNEATKYLEALAISAWAVFAPIKAVMLTTGVLIFADLATGIWAARRRKEPITSKGISRTVAKIVLYEMALAISFLVHQYMVGDALPADKLVAGLIGIVELKSILENMNSINGSPVFSTVIAKTISAERRIVHKKKKHRRR